MDTDAQVQALQKEIEELKERVQQIEARYEVAPRLPSTNLISDKFLSRSFAVFGHNFVASLIISLPFYVLAFIVMMTIGYAF